MKSSNSNNIAETHMLPKKMLPERDVFEALGFKFSEIDDPVLIQATLPIGWKHVRPFGGCWSIFLDQQNRTRGICYYRSSTVESDGFMHLSRRYHISCEHVTNTSPLTVVVKDYDDTVIFTAGYCKSAFTKEYDELVNFAKKYMSTHFPDWENHLKYWD